MMSCGAREAAAEQQQAEAAQQQGRDQDRSRNAHGMGLSLPDQPCMQYHAASVKAADTIQHTQPVCSQPCSTRKHTVSVTLGSSCSLGSATLLPHNCSSQVA